ncbi:MAG: HAD family hydrolase [Bradymonadia bacterium]
MKKLVLDLDESLVYSSMEAISPSCIELHASGSTFYTMLRPGAKTFVEYVSKRFEVTVWSTGLQSYLESVWSCFDVPGVTLWGRSFCKKIEGETSGEPYEKPLRQITEDLTQIVILDNTPAMFTKCPLNGILVRTWRGDPNDTELWHLSHYLKWLSTQPSMQRDHRAWRLEALCLRTK